MAVIRDRGAKKSIFKLKRSQMEKDGILFGEDFCFFDSHYLRLLLFISRTSDLEFKTGLPDLAGRLVCFNFNSAIHQAQLILHLGGGRDAGVHPSCLRAKVGLHLGQSVRPTGHTERQTASCTHTDRQFRFLYCHTRSTCVWTVRTQADTGRTGCKIHNPARESPESNL